MRWYNFLISFGLWAVLLSPAFSETAPAQITITVQEQQDLFRLDGAFDVCIKSGGQRCVLIQDWLKAKLSAGEKEKQDNAKKAEPKNE